MTQFSADSAAPRALPSRGRRAAVIIVYEIAALALFVFLCNAMVSVPCSTESVCSPADRTTVKSLTFGWIAAAAWALVYGWRGRLLGARSVRSVTRAERHTPSSNG